jgi:senescence-induced receptor-like serine/threonine-protein kinase
VRASFLYGNYDNLNSAQDGNPISFDIYLGSQFWESISITDPTRLYRAEVLTIARSSYISVCLRNKDSGSPFISLLELRPLSSLLYHPYLQSNKTVSLILKNRLNMGGGDTIRSLRNLSPFDFFLLLKKLVC